ncbi:MAG: hypothetical protein V4451_04745 [Pseudomonadota bacterium]
MRLDPALKAYFTRQAQINSRSLHAELVRRLEESKRRDDASVTTQGAHQVNESNADVIGGWPPLNLTESERSLLSVFKRLSPEKQLALLSLLKN